MALTKHESSQTLNASMNNLRFDPPPEPPPPVVVTPANTVLADPYYVEHGLRRVAPYHYTYNTYCKTRWRNRSMIDVFSNEFRDKTTEYYRNAIERGHIVLNGKPTTVDTIIKNGDLISHTLHRHEPPVTAQLIGIVHEDDDIIVINKPAGIPVHPTGRYNYNTVTEILRNQRGGWNPMPCNRLDRLTSGIMFIGKHRAAAEALSDQIRYRTVKKEYVARVLGEFPEEAVACDKPILQISPKLGLNRIRADGKIARTVFKRLAYYPPTQDMPQEQEPKTEEEARKLGMAWKHFNGYSIVRCLPLTGRTHQIRVHLQYLGHPISNDPIYANQRVFGVDLGQADSDSENDEDIMSRLSRMGKDEVAETVAYHTELQDAFLKRKAEKLTGELCGLCEAPLYSDPGAHELGIYLHAKKYACMEGKWEYETGLPDWALPPPGYAGPTETNAETDPLLLDLNELGLNDIEADAEQIGTASNKYISHRAQFDLDRKKEKAKENGA